jgi:hypothetical protein
MITLYQSLEIDKSYIRHFQNWGKYNVNIFYQHTCIGVGVDQTGGSRNEPEIGRGMFGTGTKSGRRTSFRTGRNIEGEKN